jgi:Ca2+-binding RTX toxin-like protein
MSKTLYVAIQFVQLHQTNPGYDAGNNAGNPYLDVAGYEIARRKYLLEVGNGDPGQPAWQDTFDHAQFQVVAATTYEPADRYARLYYDTEIGRVGYQKWYTVSVPDTFLVPNGLDAGIPPADNDSNPYNSLLPGFWGLSEGGWFGSTRSYYMGQDGSLNGVAETSGLTLAAEAAKSFIANGFQFAFSTIMKTVATYLGVSELYKAITNAGKFQSAMSDFFENASAVFNKLLLDGGTDRMDDATVIQQIDHLLRESRDGFMDAAIEVTGSGGSNLIRAMDMMRYTMVMNEAGVGPTRFTSLKLDADPYWEGSVQQAVWETASIIVDGDVGGENPILVGSERTMITAGGGDDIVEAHSSVKAMVFGDSGNDSITTAAGSDLLEGGTGDDTIVAGAGNDSIKGGADNDSIDGGDGPSDVAAFAGAWSDYVITKVGDVFTIADRTATRDGTDTVRNVESFDFNGMKVLAGAMLNVSPVIVSDGGDAPPRLQRAENTTFVTDVSASDADGTAPLYAIVGGADAAKFSIDGSTGVLRFIAAPDWETPADSGRDNVYDVIVRASDGMGFDNQALSIRVTDVDGHTIVGKSKAERIDTTRPVANTATAEEDRIDGKGGDDTLQGGSGNDTLIGGAGKDVLHGNSGYDKFVFNASLGSPNVDTIKDFVHDDDLIQLDDKIFTKIGPSLSAGEFYAKAGATQAHDKSDRIIYDTKTGKLYSDDDGKGGHAPVLFAILTGRPAIDHGDFAIV